MDLNAIDPGEPRWIPLPGIRLLAVPASTPLVFVARARAAALLVQAREAGEAVTRAGGRITGLPDLADETDREGVYDLLMTVTLAELTVSDWSGVTEGGKPAPFGHRELTRVLLARPDAADRFLAVQMAAEMEISREGEG